MLQITENPSTQSVVFQVRVQPRAGREEVVGETDGVLKVRLQAPAIEGRANEALIAFLSRVLKRPKAAVRISSGERSRLKRVEVTGVTRNDILGLLTQEA
jgi:uncharacterized protein (TIGR00251 family)